MSAQYHNISIKTDVKSFFHSITNTISYVVSNPASHHGQYSEIFGDSMFCRWHDHSYGF